VWYNILIMSEICGTIKDELHKYLFESVETAGGELYSEWKLKKRIYNYKVRRYPTGKVNEAGEIEYWFDGIMPRVNNEIKNLRLDSRYFMIWSKNSVKDFPAVYISNAALHEYMEESGRAEELSESTEDFSADGNLLMRKTDKSYEKCDMMNTFITNTLARSVNETAVIERFYLTQSELRKRDGLYTNVDNVIDKCHSTTYSPTPNIVAGTSTKSSPLYELYRRTGEVSEATLYKAQGKEGGDSKKFVLAMVIVAGLTNGGDGKDEYVLFAEELKGEMSDYFKEAHRGPYKGKWWREGLYELLLDHQTAYNELTNEIMRAIPWSTSAILASSDLQTFQNVRHGLVRGTVLKSSDIRQVQIDAKTTEAMNMRNSILTEMDGIANSYEVVRGITPASGTTLGTTQMMNENANKLFDFLRKKLAVPYRYVYREFVLPELVKDLKGKDIIRITGSEQMLEDFRMLAAEVWFNSNLALIGPHTKEMREALIKEKALELQKKDPILKNSREIWKEVLPRLFVTIVGEAYNTSEIDTIMQTIQLEQDPARRAYFLDYIYKSKGIKTPPAIAQAAAQTNEPQDMAEEGVEANPTPVGV
jgi:hypothetical protein